MNRVRRLRAKLILVAIQEIGPRKLLRCGFSSLLLEKPGKLGIIHNLPLLLVIMTGHC
jgi:hypothetical protein